MLNDNYMGCMPLPADYCPDFKQMPRVSKDNSVCNSDGLNILELCRIVNDRMVSDKKVGQFTCVDFQVCSVADYRLASKPMFTMFDTFKVHDLSVYSDHYMLSLTSTSGQDFEHLTTEHQS